MLMLVGMWTLLSTRVPKFWSIPKHVVRPLRVRTSSACVEQHTSSAGLRELSNRGFVARRPLCGGLSTILCTSLALAGIRYHRIVIINWAFNLFSVHNPRHLEPSYFLQPQAFVNFNP